MVQEYERAVIFRLGRLRKGGAKGPGIFFVIPCVDNYRKVDLRTVSFDVPPQEVTLVTDCWAASLTTYTSSHLDPFTRLGKTDRAAGQDLTLGNIGSDLNLTRGEVSWNILANVWKLSLKKFMTI